MDAGEVRAVRLSLGLSAEAFARLLQVQGGRTVRKWEAADRGVSGPVAVIAAALMESRAVREYFGVGLLHERVPGRGMSGIKAGIKESLAMFGTSYITTKMRDAAQGAAKIVATLDPKGATEAQIKEAHNKVDELAAMAAESQAKAEADQHIAEAAQAEYDRYKAAAIATNAQVEADPSKKAVLEKLLAKAEELKPQLMDAKQAAQDSKAWYEETKGYHDQAVQQWKGMREEMDRAQRDLVHAQQQEQQARRQAADRERAAGLAGSGTGNVALDAMRSAAADAKQKAAAARLTATALGHSSGVDDDVTAALAAVDKGTRPSASAADRLANL